MSENTPVNIQAMPSDVKDKIKEYADKDQRSLQRQIIFILQEYIAKRG